MANETPLERSILDIPLSGGANERDRSEVGRAGGPPFLTKVDNLEQERTGSWSKRPGSSVLGSVNDDAGDSLVSPTRLMRIKGGGLATIMAYGTGSNNAGKFMVYSEAASRMKAAGDAPRLHVTGVENVSGSANSEDPTGSCVASTPKYHAIIEEVITDTSLTATQLYVSIYDRKLQSKVYSYPLKAMATLAGYDLNINNAVVCAVGSIVHVLFAGDDNATFEGLLLGFVINTGAVLPVYSAVTLTELHSLAADSVTILDYAAGSDRVYVLYDATAGRYVRSVGDDGASISSDTLTGALSIYATDSKLWYITSANLGARNLVTLTTVDVAAAAHGGYGTGTPYIYADNNESVYVAVSNASATFGGSTIYSVGYYKTSAPNGTTLNHKGYLDGWKLAACPFGDGTTGEAFIHVIKDNGTDQAQHNIVRLDTVTGYVTSSIPSATIACAMEPHFAVVKLNLLCRYYRSQNQSAAEPGQYSFGALVCIQTAARSFCSAVYTMSKSGAGRVSVAEFGGVTHVSGGFNSTYAGEELADSGFNDQPTVNTADSGVAGNLYGAYKYVAVFRYTDPIGNVTFSRVSNISSVTVASKKVTVKITAPAVGSKYGIPAVEVYRTKAGGTIYYLCGSSQFGTAYQSVTMASGTTRFCTLTDNYSDATLDDGPLMFRQPGTANSAVDRYPPPPGLVMCQHKDRLFVTDASGLRVMYSSFHVDGEAAWFNPVFSFVVHGGSGRVTAMASMDGRLFIFKRDGIFVVDGDGPAEGGVAGNEFSPPMRLATEYGCVDHRSIIVSTEGIIYRSQRGIELLTRSLQVKWIGERVQDTVDAHDTVKGALLDHSGRYRILLADNSANTAGEDETSILNGCELVYDIPGDCWSRNYFSDLTTADAGTAKIYNSIAMADLDGLGETVCYAAQGGIRYQDDTTSMDDGYTTAATEHYPSFKIETSWVKLGQQSRHRFSKAMFLAKKLSGSNHSITVSLGVNYNDTYSQTKTFQPGTFNSAAIEELILQISSQEVLAVRMKVTDAAPTDTTTYPVGKGEACDILGLSVEVAQKRGAPTLDSDRRG